MSSSGLITFYAKDELRRYLRSLVEGYQAASQRYGDQLGGLLRTLEQQKAAVKVEPKGSKDKAQAATKTMARGWTRMGSLLVNINDPSGAMAEVLYQLHEDIKARLAKASEAAKSFEELGNTNVPEAGLYYLQMRNGVPERLVVDLQQSKKDAFSFSADFQLV